MNVRTVVITALFLLGSATGCFALTLASGGRTRYVIVTAPDASPAVQNGAAELSGDLKQSTGADFRVVAASPRGPAILLGSAASTTGGSDPLAALPDESFQIRTAGNNLILRGKGDRGTLYAIYTFLETYAGARWYAPDCTVLPQRTRLAVGRLDDVETPAFTYRDTDEGIVGTSAAWDAHLKLDGVSVPDDPSVGGNNRLFNGAENFYELVPPAKYFATHPEYYSLINGKRTAVGDSQLCLTNPDVFRIVVDALVAQAKAHPDWLALGLSPNDAGDGNCQCDNCRASDARYGAPSGTLIDFVNRVAAAVQEQLPGRKIWVETLAYQYTQRAPNPGSIAPANNVLVCLAPIFACDGHPLATDPQNKDSNAALLAWSKIAPGHLQIWHYVTNFAHYLQPYPDWDELGADMAYYQANGVSGMFCEGDYNNRLGELMPMRTWVMAHLFWNPHQDVWALLKDYCDGYYGPAGKDVYGYLRLLHDQLQLPDVHLHLYDPPTSPLLKPAVLAQADAFLDQAAVDAQTPAQKDRVEMARMGTLYVETVTHVPGKGASDADKAQFRQNLQRLAGDVQQFNVTYIHEGGPVGPWLRQMQQAADAA